MTSGSRARRPTDTLARRAASSADAAAVWLPDGIWTYRELDRAAAEVARGLRGLGLGAGAVIGASLDADAAGLAALHGAVRAGSVLAPGHPAWSAAERASHLAALAPEAVITPRGGPGPEPAVIADPVTETLALTGPAGAELWLDVHLAAPGGSPADEARRAWLGGGGVDLLVWTSGTEGHPRIACHGWRELAHAARAANRRVRFGAGDRWLASLALAHIGGLAVPIRAVEGGAAVAFSERGFDPERTRAALDRSRATHVSLVPAMLQRLLEAREGPPPALRCALVGGDAAPSRLVERALAAGWPLALTYGLTEAGSQVATAPPDLVRRKPGTVGPPLEGFEVRVGDAGEIRVRGPGIMKGYLAGDGSRLVAPEGWLETGDVGEVDDEGHLWVSGRISNRIVSGGATVSPAEVESALRSHEAVAEAAVVGVPDDTWGERVAAVIVPASGAGKSAATLATELEAWARRRLSGPRIPRIWVIVERLPRTPTGKPDRSALRSLAEAAIERSGRPAGAASRSGPETPGE